MADQHDKAVVYYSLTGNCAFVAQTLGKQLGARVLELLPEKEPPRQGARSLLLGGIEALSGSRPRLLNGRLDMTPYKTIVVVAPVWAGKPAPAVRTFMDEVDVTGKRLAFIACSKSGRGDSTLSAMREALGVGNDVVAELSLVQPLDHEEETREDLLNFSAKLS